MLTFLRLLASGLLYRAAHALTGAARALDPVPHRPTSSGALAGKPQARDQGPPNLYDALAEPAPDLRARAAAFDRAAIAGMAERRRREDPAAPHPRLLPGDDELL